MGSEPELPPTTQPVETNTSEPSSDEDLPSILKEAIRNIGVPNASVSSTQQTLPAASNGSSGTKLPVVDPSHYTIEEEIARGGLGRILRAYDKRLKRHVAVKELLQDHNHSRERFLI